MVQSTIYLISDDNQVIEKAKQFWNNFGISVHVYSVNEWNTSVENNNFIQKSKITGIPSLVYGNNPLNVNENQSGQVAKVLPFPNSHIDNVDNVDNNNQSKVSTINELESVAIQNAILTYKGNLTEAAKALGIGRATLYRKVKQYNIDTSVARKKKAA